MRFCGTFEFFEDFKGRKAPFSPKMQILDTVISVILGGLHFLPWDLYSTGTGL
jgi:hypothetical protein